MSKKKNIQMLPASLCGLLIIISFGPWNIYNISKHNQISRLEKFLIEDGLLKDGKITVPNTKQEDTNDVKSILKYLDRWHDYSHIQKWFQQDILKESSYSLSKMLNYTSKSYPNPNFYFKSSGLKSLSLNTAHTIFFLQTRYNDKSILIEENGYKTYTKGRSIIVENSKGQFVSFDLEDITKTLNQKAFTNKYSVPPKDLIFEKSTNSFKSQFIIQNISVKQSPYKLNNMQGMIIVKDIKN